MRIKNVVKVMNFHSLLRVDSAKKKADKYLEIEKELTKMITTVQYNRNLMLDNKSLKPNKNNPVLDIYMGNDYGFCGNFNQKINEEMESQENNHKIVIGKKMRDIKSNLILKISKEELKDKFNLIEEIIFKGIKEMSYSQINVIYNHYNSINSFTLTRKPLFPVEFEKDKINNHNEDFVIEADINNIFVNLITTYISYQLKIAEASSFAAENVMRQQITRESLKKIDEIEFYKLRKAKKHKKYKDFKKIIENYQRKGI